MIRTKQFVLNAIILLMSAAIGLMLCEWGARIFLNPADYLSIEITNDPILGGIPSESTRSAYDAWGFRNHSVPAQADFVTVGDSHTYGNTARMMDSWPMVAANLTGLSVYNLGFGGYGPNQYYHLFQTKALSLRPKVVVCGLYMGDDFENAYLMTYGREHWAYLRKLPSNEVNFDIWEAPSREGFAKELRIWLSRHSVVYKLVFHGQLAAWVKGHVQVKNASELYANATTLVVPEKNITEAFLPTGIQKRVNQDSKSVQEGMRITFKLLKAMHKKCQESGCEFLVAVIPTKESVFAEYLENNNDIPLSSVLQSVIHNERLARERVFAFFDREQMPYVDMLPVLRANAGHQLYARTATDMHPGKNGYAVIGAAVADELKRRSIGN